MKNEKKDIRAKLKKDLDEIKSMSASFQGTLAEIKINNIKLNEMKKEIIKEAYDKIDLIKEQLSSSQPKKQKIS